MEIKSKTIDSVIYKGRRIKVGLVLNGKSIPANLGGADAFRCKVRIIGVSKKDGITLKYENRFDKEDPLIKRHREINFSKEEFSETHWFSECPEVS